MYVYKDFNYVNYIIGSTFENWYKLFIKCRDRIIDEHNNKLFQLYLVDIQHGYKGTFNDYMKEQENKSKFNNNFSLEFAISEEERIINNGKDKWV